MVYAHGYGKITGGVEQWSKNGEAIGSLGIHFAYPFWGFMCAFTEFVGGIFIALGLLFRPFAILMIINFIVASYAMLQAAPFAQASNPIVFLAVFIGLLLTGPGKISGDQLIGLNK
jgi:putative oxidoreductase